MRLDISSLERAVARLEEALQLYRQDTSQIIVRDALVQRFEFTYEIAQKLLRRYLAENAIAPELISGMNLADVIRVGNENHLLLGNWPRWKGYRDMRSRTSHTYDEVTAIEVVAGLPDFLEEAKFLRDRLKERATE